VLIGKDGNFAYVSPSARRLFGYSAEEVISFHPDEFTHPDDLPMVMDNLNKVVQDASFAPTIEYRFQNRAGKWLRVAAFCTKFKQFAVLIEDITESRNLKE
jgi:PAS domain S-box-containing protein